MKPTSWGAALAMVVLGSLDSRPAPVRTRKAQSLAKPSSNRKAQALEKALRRQERNNRP